MVNSTRLVNHVRWHVGRINRACKLRERSSVRHEWIALCQRWFGFVFELRDDLASEQVHRSARLGIIDRAEIETAIYAGEPDRVARLLDDARAVVGAANTHPALLDHLLG